jgi:hypothetical protein
VLALILCASSYLYDAKIHVILQRNYKRYQILLSCFSALIVVVPFEHKQTIVLKTDYEDQLVLYQVNVRFVLKKQHSIHNHPYPRLIISWFMLNELAVNLIYGILSSPPLLTVVCRGTTFPFLSENITSPIGLPIDLCHSNW